MAHLAVPRLMDEDPAVRLAALEVIASAASSSSSGSVRLGDEVCPLLSDPVWYCRRAAVVAVGSANMQPGKVQHLLVSRLADASAEVRVAALQQLGRLAASGSFPKLMPSPGWPPPDAAASNGGTDASNGSETFAVVPISALLADTDSGVRAAAASALSRHPAALVSNAASVAEMLRDSAAEVRATAATALSMLDAHRCEEYARPLAALAHADPDPDVRRAASDSLVNRLGLV